MDCHGLLLIADEHVLGRFAPQFAGYGQQDSQELCNYVLDKLHEDTNRVRKKPYVETFEAKGTEPDVEIAREVTRRHKLRNDSYVADLFEGYFKSTVICPLCSKVSVGSDLT
jgi:ubiquitin C-terminal hydrolase